MTISGDFFAPNEVVYLWYTDAASNSVQLGIVTADADGKISFTFTPTGLTPGSTYVVAGYGNLTGVYSSVSLTISGE